ncbi:MAG: DUF3048 domain-containing protein [Clostridia bacterium]|nr:DUF3048 domain-containing protein [Clostridia bacterium]
MKKNIIEEIMMRKNIIIPVVIAVLALILVIFAIAANKDESNYEQTGEVTTTEPSGTPKDDYTLPQGVNTLTGKKDLSDSAIGGRPIAIMVENSPAARPQWGITTPDIVLEGVVEGGITRMMWIYADAEDIPEKVGPVRSARHDYVEIAKGMNAIFVHWGGSDAKNYTSKGKFTLAYETIANLSVNNLDATKAAGAYFFRDNTRNTSSEHRGCTKGEMLINAISKFGYETKQTVENWEPFNVSQEGATNIWGDTSVTGDCKEISVTFSTGYVHTFKYDAETKKYTNYLNGKAMTDGNNNKEMAVENVIVMYTPVTTLNTGKGHQEWNMEVRGEGFYVSNGVGQKINWQKHGTTGALKFYSVNGQELMVSSGQTWIGVVPEANRSLTTVTE